MKRVIITGKTVDESLAGSRSKDFNGIRVTLGRRIRDALRTFRTLKKYASV
jgi:hypothetical protein